MEFVNILQKRKRWREGKEKETEIWTEEKGENTL